jgi:hypothetical protein
MKARAALCLMLTLMFAASGCAKNPAAKEAAAPDGWYAAGDVAYGGNTETAQDINAKALSVVTQPNGEDTETVLQFSFVTGSRMSGGEAETSGCGVPAYSVYVLDNPARIIVELDSVTHWDYSHAIDLVSPLLRGVFQYALADTTRTRVCFQLSEPAFFSAHADGDTLRITLLPHAEKEQTLYYVTANAYKEYCAGTIPSACGVSPTLASNLQDILLITEPFPTRQEADAFVVTAQGLCPDLPEGLWRSVALKSGELPDYDRSLDHLNVTGTPAVRLPDGREKALPVLAPDGLYLCSLPNNAGFLFSRELAPDLMGSSYQQLYKMKWDGQESLATAFEFASIEKAEYSPDGRKLAVLERAEGSTHLYVFDADTYELLNDLSQMGFGGNTSTFLWNSMGTILYAITGVDGIELHQFDYSIPDEANRQSTVDSNSVDEGSLGYCNGELYFAHATMEEGSIIYRIKPEGGVRKPFMPGRRFAISGDAQYIAIVDSHEGSGSAAALKLYETETGSTRTITSDFYTYDFIWSQDCTRLYYIESRISGGQTEDETSGEGEGEAATDDDAAPEDTATPSTATPEDTSASNNTAAPTDSVAGDTGDATAAPADPYPYTLWVYDIASGTSERLLDLAAPSVFAGGRADLLYLNRYETDDTGTLMRASYLLDLSSVFKAYPETSPDVSPLASPVE